MNQKSEADEIINLLTRDIDSIDQKTIWNRIISKIKGIKKPWYSKTKKESIWKRSRIINLLDNSLYFRIILSLLLAYFIILAVTFSEKAFKGENICFRLECIVSTLWSSIKIDNIEGFSIVAVSTLYLIESRDRKRKEEYNAWQVIDTAQSGGRKKSIARLKALEDLNSIKASLRDQNFDNIDLQGINLNKSNLQGSSFLNTILDHANLSEALLVKVNFANAKLCAVNLERANLNIANLDNADLTLSKLTRSLMVGSSAQGTNFRNAKMEKSDLRRANLQRANLSGANLENSLLSFADLQKSYIMGTNLKNAELSYTQLSGAIYSDKETATEVFEILQEIRFNYFAIASHYTIFPNGFDPQKAGMIKIELILPTIIDNYYQKNPGKNNLILTRLLQQLK
jgi:uncharacterized protein YjbI with pentapeptide repeats